MDEVVHVRLEGSTLQESAGKCSVVAELSTFHAPDRVAGCLPDLGRGIVEEHLERGRTTLRMLLLGDVHTVDLCGAQADRFVFGCQAGVGQSARIFAHERDQGHMRRTALANSRKGTPDHPIDNRTQLLEVLATLPQQVKMDIASGQEAVVNVIDEPEKKRSRDRRVVRYQRTDDLGGHGTHCRNAIHYQTLDRQLQRRKMLRVSLDEAGDIHRHPAAYGVETIVHQVESNLVGILILVPEIRGISILVFRSGIAIVIVNGVPADDLQQFAWEITLHVFEERSRDPSTARATGQPMTSLLALGTK